MTEFSCQQQIIIEDLYEELNSMDVSYVTLRGYENLPTSVPGGDIDIFIEPEQFQKAVDQVENLGFTSSKADRVERIQERFFELANNPNKAVNFAQSKPIKALLLALGNEKQSSAVSLRGTYLDKRRYKNDVMFHMVNHLAYESPLNGKMVRVDPSVEDSIITNRRTDGLFPTPSPPDELAHLLCRGVFDKKGKFPSYYTKRCDKLWTKINSKTSYENRFEDLLQEIFFGAYPVIYDVLEDRRYNTLRRKLKSYSNY